MAWILSECMCMTIGLGAYPSASKPKCGQGPTDLKQYHQWSVYGIVLSDMVLTVKYSITLGYVLQTEFLGTN
jgi:hypothetical protein